MIHFADHNCTQVYKMRDKSFIAAAGLRSIRAAAAKYKIPYSTVSGRLRSGWSLKRALTTPVHVQTHRRHVEILRVLGFSNVFQMCKLLDLPYDTVARRLRRGQKLSAAIQFRPTLRAQAAALGISPGTLYNRRSLAKKNIT